MIGWLFFFIVAWISTRDAKIEKHYREECDELRWNEEDQVRYWKARCYRDEIALGKGLDWEQNRRYDDKDFNGLFKGPSFWKEKDILDRFEKMPRVQMLKKRKCTVCYIKDGKK